MKAHPTVSKYMTTLPHTIGADQPLSRADKMMAELRVRHLPVLDGGHLIGVVTDRDVRLAETFLDVNMDTTAIRDVCSPDPYLTTPNSTLKDVCATMASRKIGCAIVCDNGKLVGIFTWVDALTAFQEVLEARFHA